MDFTLIIRFPKLLVLLSWPHKYYVNKRSLCIFQFCYHERDIDIKWNSSTTIKLIVLYTIKHAVFTRSSSGLVVAGKAAPEPDSVYLYDSSVTY